MLARSTSAVARGAARSRWHPLPVTRGVAQRGTAASHVCKSRSEWERRALSARGDSTAVRLSLQRCDRARGTTPPGRVRNASSEAEAADGAAAEAGAVEAELTTKEWLHLAGYSAVPMVGFGIMDQMIMIQAGDYIDSTIGVTLGLSTLTAAACGQVFSDLGGVTFGGTVEAAVAKLGVKPPNISMAQRLTSRAKFANTFGMAAGVVCGCLIGMTSLLFMDLDKADRLKREKQLNSIFETVLDVSDTFEAERCSLFMVDDEKQELWSRVFDNAVVVKDTGQGKDEVKKERVHISDKQTHNDVFVMPMSKGVAGLCARSGKIVNAADAYKHPHFLADVDVKTGFKTKSLLCGPVFSFDEPGKVVAVISIINKTGNGGAFTSDDEKLLTMLCTHVGAFLHHVE